MGGQSWIGTAKWDTISLSCRWHFCSFIAQEWLTIGQEARPKSLGFHSFHTWSCRFFEGRGHVGKMVLSARELARGITTYVKVRVLLERPQSSDG